MYDCLTRGFCYNTSYGLVEFFSLLGMLSDFGGSNIIDGWVFSITGWLYFTNCLSVLNILLHAVSCSKPNMYFLD